MDFSKFTPEINLGEKVKQLANQYDMKQTKEYKLQQSFALVKKRISEIVVYNAQHYGARETKIGYEDISPPRTPFGDGHVQIMSVTDFASVTTSTECDLKAWANSQGLTCNYVSNPNRYLWVFAPIKDTSVTNSNTAINPIGISDVILTLPVAKK